jgi:4'-phosphopantetheinyl transferase
VCLVPPPGTPIGCDLELVEPRSDAFVADYLTPAEQRLVAAAGEGDARELLANLVWCGKESALKVLRTGLRRDTRSVEVSFPDGEAVSGWAPMSVRAVEGAVFAGWWQRFGAFLLTVAATGPVAPPRPLADPPGLARAVPAHSWLSEPNATSRTASAE